MTTRLRCCLSKWDQLNKEPGKFLNEVCGYFIINEK